MTDRDKPRRARELIGRYAGVIREQFDRASRFIARNFRGALPVILDLAAFVVIVVGAVKLFGDWAWLVAGALLILAGLRAQT